MALPETSPAMSTVEHLMSSVELWGTEYETAGRLGVAPGTATTDEPTDVSAVAGRWALTLGDAVGADAATDIVTAALEWLAARYHVGLALAAADAPDADDDAFALGRTLGAAEEHARHLREVWALPVLVAWSDETAEA